MQTNNKKSLAIKLGFFVYIYLDFLEDLDEEDAFLLIMLSSIMLYNTISNSSMSLPFTFFKVAFEDKLSIFSQRAILFIEGNLIKESSWC